MSQALERLEELLDLKDEEIERLQEQLSAAEQRAEANHRWTTHIEVPTDNHPDLPLPRLELLWDDLGERGDGEGYATQIRYDLVYRHYRGHIEHVPMGSSRTSARIEKVTQYGKIDLPYRDGAHILYDMAHLGIPAFAIIGARIDQLTWDYIHTGSTASQRGREARYEGKFEKQVEEAK